MQRKHAPWIPPLIKTAIKRNTRIYQKWVRRGRNHVDHHKVREVQNVTNRLIKEAKLSYYTDLGKKLSNPNIGHKHFWSAYKKIANKNKNTNIPPIIDNDTYITDCQKKAKVFNEYFAKQCTLNDNESVLPNLVLKLKVHYPTPMYRKI